MLFNFFYRQKTIFECNPEVWEESEVTCSKTRKIPLLGHGWKIVCQKLLHCEGCVMRHIVVVQDPVVAPFFRPILPNGALKHFRNLIQKAGCIIPKMSRIAISMTC
jgi:hypothetical protein